jgi:hypothetical protein
MLAGALLLAGAGPASPAVVSTDLNVRSGPGTGYGVVATLPAGAQVGVLGCNGGWCRVSFGGGEGYVSARYLAGGGGPAYGNVPVYVAPPIFDFGYGGSWRHGGHGYRGGYRGGGYHGGRASAPAPVVGGGGGARAPLGGGGGGGAAPTPR